MLATLRRDGTPQMSPVLAAVDDGGERASHLASGLAVAKPTITAAVDGLVERGYLAREPVPRDRRSVRISLTPAGRRCLAEAEAAMAESLSRILEDGGHRGSALTALAEFGPALEQPVGGQRR